MKIHLLAVDLSKLAAPVTTLDTLVELLNLLNIPYYLSPEVKETLDEIEAIMEKNESLNYSTLLSGRC